MTIESPEQLFSFISKEEAVIDLKHLDNIQETTVSCGDPLLNSQAEWRLVGGSVYLYLNEFLEQYISKREGKNGILEAHLACGWMFTKGYQTYERQNGLIVATREQIVDLNRKYGTSFIVPEPEMHGSAAPFMINSDSSY